MHGETVKKGYYYTSVLPLALSSSAVYFLVVIYLKLESFGEEQGIQSQLYFAVICILCNVFRL